MTKKPLTISCTNDVPEPACQLMRDLGHTVGRLGDTGQAVTIDTPHAIVGAMAYRFHPDWWVRNDGQSCAQLSPAAKVFLKSVERAVYPPVAKKAAKRK